MRNPYPSDISQEQFEKIKPLLESSKKRTKPRIIDLYEVFGAIFSKNRMPMEKASISSLANRL